MSSEKDTPLSTDTPDNTSQIPRSALTKHTLSPHTVTSPAKRRNWNENESGTLVRLRGEKMQWEDISKQLPGRSAVSCRLRYQNYLERQSSWDEKKKTQLALLYERFKQDMWNEVAKEMNVPWRTVESMHWQLGEKEMALRAGVAVFSKGASFGGEDLGQGTVASSAEKGTSKEE